MRDSRHTQPRSSERPGAATAALAKAARRLGRSTAPRPQQPPWLPPWLHRLRWLACCSGLALSAGPGCAPPPVRSVTNPDPSGKIPAIKEAAEHHDRRVVPQLIQDLDNDDPAVRFYAIQGLQRITGETFGYRCYEDDAQRQPAVGRWHKWWAEQKVQKVQKK